MQIHALISEVEDELREAEIARLAWKDALRVIRPLIKRRLNANTRRTGEAQSKGVPEKR